MNTYIVVFENSKGDIHTVNCVADSLRTASMSGTREIEESKTLSKSDYVVISITPQTDLQYNPDKEV